MASWFATADGVRCSRDDPRCVWRYWDRDGLKPGRKRAAPVKPEPAPAPELVAAPPVVEERAPEPPPPPPAPVKAEEAAPPPKVEAAPAPPSEETAGVSGMAIAGAVVLGLALAGGALWLLWPGAPDDDDGSNVLPFPRIAG